jgi:hypothetical protein
MKKMLLVMTYVISLQAMEEVAKKDFIFNLPQKEALLICEKIFHPDTHAFPKQQGSDCHKESLVNLRALMRLPLVCKGWRNVQKKYLEQFVPEEISIPKNWITSHKQLTPLEERTEWLFITIENNGFYNKLRGEKVYKSFSREYTAFRLLLALQDLKQDSSCINSPNEFGSYVIFAACRKEQRELVLLLLKYGANPNVECKYIEWPKPTVMRTVLCNPLQIIEDKLLIKKDDDKHAIQNLTNIKNDLLKAGAVMKESTEVDVKYQSQLSNYPIDATWI